MGIDGRELHERSLCALFDEAMRKREAGELPQAATMLEELLRMLGPSDRRLTKGTHLQLGYIAKLRSRSDERLQHFADATMVAPRSELASLALFHTLEAAGRRSDGFDEAIRFVTLMYSPGYSELFVDGYGRTFPENERQLVNEARRLLSTRLRVN